ncbi:DUF4176 domain-containing protein [Weissella confusa]|uniref:DUF4176 domain-containing protein n=1 Tax=Weissella confusa TaxID=1583 RepID=UPI001C6F7E52|nr:DUF4176 domain-containing protein [Weissella confusa]QYU58618.1 DUF4176 domain-containing protein [Weissella confusa]
MKYLPNGSVVQLKNSDSKVMIIARQVEDTGTGSMFDYGGALYPIGLIASDRVFMFNDVDIEALYFIGFQDIDELEFQKSLENNVMGD